jgi:hypothetical protein
MTIKLAKAHSQREEGARRRSALFAAAQERSTRRDEERQRERSERSQFEEKYMVCWANGPYGARGTRGLGRVRPQGIKWCRGSQVVMR